MKKIFIVSASLFVVTLLFLGVYNLAFRSGVGQGTVDEEKRLTAKEEAEKAFQERLAKAPLEPVSDTPVFGAGTTEDGRIAFFRDGALRTFTLGGGGESVLVPDLPGKTISVRWAPDRKQVLALLDDGAGRRWHLIDLGTGSITRLKEGISSPTWSNLSERIFYFYQAPDKKSSLNSARPDGTDWKEIAILPALREPLCQTIPGSALVSFWSRPSAFEETSLHTVPITGGEPEKIFDGKYGADFLWSPDGRSVLISNTLGKGGTEIRLGIANQKGGEFHTLQAPTFTSKAAWSKDAKTVYYALPLSLPDGTVVPDDYFDELIHTSDSFWKIDTSTGKSERIIAPENIPGNFDSTDLFLDDEETYLFFTNRTDGRLYRIRLTT